MKYLPGSTILDVEPICWVLNYQQRGKLCDTCFRPAKSTLRRCSACKVLYFCGQECQLRLWPLHRNECSAIKFLSQSSISPQDWLPTDSVRLLFYFVEIYLDNSLLAVDKNDPHWKNSVFDLISHASDIRLDFNRSEQFAQVMVTLKRMADILENHSIPFKLPSANELLNLFGIICVNGIYIVNQEMNVFGTGLYLSPSTIDHSCVPNCVAIFDKTRLVLRPISEIDTDIENLTINYVDLLQTRTERLSQLQSRYYFSCNCSSCVENSNMDIGMKAANCGKCGSKLLNSSCAVCGPLEFDSASFDLAMNDAMFTVEQLKNRRNHGDWLSSEMAEKIVSMVDKCFKRIKPFLHDSNILITQMADMATEACITLAQWENALEYSKLALVGYRLYLPPNFPTLGLLIAKIGKIMLYLGTFDRHETLKILQEAEAILSIAYPPSFEIVLDVRNLISQCEEEMRCQQGSERLLAIAG